MESSDSMELFLSENRFLFCVLLCSHARTPVWCKQTV